MPNVTRFRHQGRRRVGAVQMRAGLHLHAVQVQAPRRVHLSSRLHVRIALRVRAFGRLNRPTSVSAPPKSEERIYLRNLQCSAP